MIGRTPMVPKAARYLSPILLLIFPALSASLVREEKALDVGGAAETWKLEWKQSPVAACAVDNADAFTCPCAGFAYGEQGPVNLIRMRGDRVIERLALAPFFTRDGGWGEPILQQWPRLPEDNITVDARDLAKRAQARGLATVMDFVDYDHDGQSAEFFLQTGTRPCGKQVGVVIGVSPGRDKLHAFGSALHPGRPLYLQKQQWDALRTSAGPVKVLDRACGDQGSIKEIEIELEATGSAIRAFRIEYGCTEKRRGKLLVRKQL